MGYSTEFVGEIKIDPPLNDYEREYLTKFSSTRRMHRKQGPWYVEDDESQVYNVNKPPPGQPHLWCDFGPNEEGTALVWNGAEKTKCAKEWLEYLINRFLMEGALTQDSNLDQFEEFQYNHILNGVLEAQGDWPKDRWKLIVKNNHVTVVKATDWKMGN
jgi:hypothetical protein